LEVKKYFRINDNDDIEIIHRFPFLIFKFCALSYTKGIDFCMNETWAKIKTNRMVLIMNIVICSALTIGYLADFIRGRRTVGVISIVLAVVIVQLCINIVVYRRNKASEAMKYSCVFGSLIIYCVANFITDTYFTFIYIFPMLILYILYYNAAFIRMVGIVSVILNIAKILFLINSGHVSSTDTTSYIVQFASVVIFVIGLYFLTELTNKINKEKVDKLLETNKSVSELMKNAENASREETGLVRNILDIIPSFVSATKQIAEGSQLLALGTTEQAASVEELSNSIAEINNMAKENSRLTIVTYDEVREVGRLMSDCIEQVEQMLVAMRTIDEKSQNIGKTTKVIDDIAFQTNILALNAAVEAARAGTQGKGFAVVAEEVRNLASRSADAAKETSALVESSSLSVAKGNEIVEKLSASLQSVAVIAQNNAEQIARVQLLSTQQSAEIEPINTGIDQVARIIQQNSATAEESAAASEEMSAQATHLERMMYEYKERNSDDNGVHAQLTLLDTH